MALHHQDQKLLEEAGRRPSSERPKSKVTHIHGWRVTVAIGIVTALLVLGLNIGILVWVSTRFETHQGIATVYEGSCSQTERISTWSHLAINVFSTLLLGASNNAMQCLSAPTRQEVDRVHAKNSWMEVGISGIRNLSRISPWRTAIWLFLGLSSIPLHLLYNSAISSTQSANEYLAIWVSPEFLHGGPWSLGDSQTYADRKVVGTLQQNNTSLLRMDYSTCITTYSGEFISEWKNVLFVSSQASPSATVYEVFHESLSKSGSWQCGVGGTPNSCIFGNLTAPISLDYCLAEPFSPHCTVQISVLILAIVVACNATKAASLTSTLLIRFQPLVTIGDAIASFLDNPDDTTSSQCIVSHRDIKDGIPVPIRSALAKKALIVDLSAFPQQWQPHRYRLFRGASTRRWLVCTVACLTTWIVGIYLISQSSGRIWSRNIGNVSMNSLVQLTKNISLLGNVVLVNVPQLLISTLYLTYNGLFTCMLLLLEYNRFTVQRKALRVSTPKGQQRSTYYLQLPWKYSIPLIVASGLLHWLVSQSIFLARISTYDMNGIEQPTKLINTCGYSAMALVYVLIVGGVMMIALWSCAFIKLNPTLLMAPSCSVAISAACHPLPEDFDAAVLPIKYGIVRTENRTRYASFSSMDVEPLLNKRRYT